jgi:hypothetical protein
MQIRIWMLAVMSAGLALPAAAHELSINECVEGGDFIMHAAQSRDYGLTREEFIGRMQGDLLAIQSFPQELRWFVQDEDDEALLVAHAERVFDAPQEPAAHQADFLSMCFARMGQQSQTSLPMRAADAER